MLSVKIIKKSDYLNIICLKYENIKENDDWSNVNEILTHFDLCVHPYLGMLNTVRCNATEFLSAEFAYESISRLVGQGNVWGNIFVSEGIRRQAGSAVYQNKVLFFLHS